MVEIELSEKWKIFAKVFQKLSQLGPDQEVERLLMSSSTNWSLFWGGSANTKPLEFGVQSGDYANKWGYDNSDYDNEEFMENGDPLDDRNETWHQTQAKRKFMIIWNL